MALLSKSKRVTIPDPAPTDEPIYLPRPGRPWTAEDLLALADDENRYELVRGDLIMMSPASPVQGRYASRLGAALFNYVDERDLGEVYTAEPGFELESGIEKTIRAPDIAFVSKTRIPPKEEQAGFWTVAPDLVVEIISPSETAEKVQEKVQDYLAAGSQLVWLVYPGTKRVIEHQASGRIRQFHPHESLVGGEVIPDFVYPLQKLFR